MSALEIFLIALLGLGAGVIGGLAGVGGSLIMLPGLHLIYPRATPEDHHLFIAAAMTVNVAVSIPAALQHRKAGALRVDLLKHILPAAVVFILIGVLVSNLFEGDKLKLGLAAFILGYVGLNIHKLLRSTQNQAEARERTGRLRLMGCGVATGSAAGVLGLGGGVLLVPLLQVVSRIRLREAVATSSAVICVTAPVGAMLKLATLGEHHERPLDALTFAAIMAPTAMIGARMGAKLTHTLPLRGVRLAVSVLLAIAAANMIRSALE